MSDDEIDNLDSKRKFVFLDSYPSFSSQFLTFFSRLNLDICPFLLLLGTVKQCGCNGAGQWHGPDTWLGG